MQTLSNGKVKRGAGEWAEIFSRQSRSGLSSGEFCEKEGIARTSFSKWQKRLSANGGGEKFIELPPGALGGEAGRCVLELELGDGIRVTVRR